MSSIPPNPTQTHPDHTPCPTWCALPDGHHGGLDTDGSRAVEHIRPLAESTRWRVELRQVVIVDTDGTVDTEPPGIVIDGDWLSPYTPEQAGSLGAALVAASDRLTEGGGR